MKIEIEYIEETRQEVEILVEQIQIRFWALHPAGGLSLHKGVPVFKRTFELRLKRPENEQS